MPDQNEAVSYAVAAVLTKGDIIVENARPQHMEAFLVALDRLGGGYEIGDYGIRFFYKGLLTATDITTEVYPGFKTDWQPLWAVLLTQARGTSTIHETIQASRFQYSDALTSMGAEISFYTPEVADFDAVYGFSQNEYKKNPHAIRITGPVDLKPFDSTVPDLRAGATVLLAGLIANGTSILRDQEHHVERGYEAITERLRSMGAKIDRLEE